MQTTTARTPMKDEGVSVTPGRPTGKRHGLRPTLRVNVSNQQQKATLGQRKVVKPTAILTPPLTPSFSSASSSDGDSASFHNYLRVLYDFRPDGPITSETDETSITIPISSGDIVLVHTIQPNGWADGTLLSSGLRGWLPTNYCCVYSNESMSVLLDAATFAWDFIRSNEGGDRLMFTRQDYVRRTIAGVRILLQRSECLNRDSTLITQHAGLRRLRKGLLGDLSAFAKAANSLQEACQVESAHEQTLFALLDAVVLRAFRVVTRAVRFVDLWSLCVSGQRRVDGGVAGMTTPPLSAGPEPSPTRANRALEHSYGHSDHPHTTPVSSSSATSNNTTTTTTTTTSSSSSSSSSCAHEMRDRVSHPSDSAAATTLPHHLPSPNTTATSTSSSHLAAPDSNSSTSTPPFSSHSQSQSQSQFQFQSQSSSQPSDLLPHTAGSQPSHHHISRPSSITPTSKRISASHRSSYTLRTSSARGNVLVSAQLQIEFDSFLGSLGNFIGNHIQSRSSMDLLVTTQQSVVACQGLLKVVEQIWERDCRRATDIDESRLAMHARLAELVHATKEIFEASNATNGTEAYLPEQGKRLMDAATLCVRGAGECVFKSRNVVDRIGDFEFEPVGLGITREHERQGSERSQSPALKARLQHQLEPETRNSIQKPLPLIPRARTSFQRPTEPSNRPVTAHQLSHERASSSHSDCTESTLHVSNVTRVSLRSSSLPRSPVDTASQRLSTEPTRTSGTAPTFLTLDVDIPHTSFIDMSNTPATASSSQSRFERSDSAGESVADSTQTYWSSNRHSTGSGRPSTRATTPDHVPYRECSTESLQNSVGSSQDSDPVCAHEADVSEARILAPTHAHELVHNKDGLIIGGSLSALVERLTTHDSTPDALFVNTFYLTFRLFTTPIALAQALIARFDQTVDDDETSTPVRLRVSNVFKGWLETCWRQDSDHEALPSIQAFAYGKLQLTLPAASRRLIELIAHVREMRNSLSQLKASPLIGRPHALSNVNLAQENVTPSPIVSKGQLNALRNTKSNGQQCSILDFDPMELARQFTIKQSKVFCAIQPEELLALEWTKKNDSKATNVLAMSSLSTDLANLVADTILQLELKKRAVVLKQWVKIAGKCLELGNYDALMAIICSLNSSMVLRLKKTWDLVSPKTLAKLDYLKTVVDVSRNYAVLRQRLSTHCAPCIPFVGMYLTDLTFVDVGNQPTRQLPGEASGSAVINFDKHMKTAKIINDLQRFQIPHKLNAVPEMQEWMDAQIGRVSNCDQANVQNYYRRSLMLEPREATTAAPTGARQKTPPESASSSFSGSTTSTKERFEFWGTKQFLMGNREKASS